MNRPLAMAVVGAGRLGGFHAQKLAAMSNVRLVGIVDPVEASRHRLAAACKTTPFATPDELLSAQRPDAVVVAAPTPLHHRLGLGFLNAGIHVLMEKPLAVTAAECDELLAAARSQSVVLQVGHVERFNPAFVAALPHVRSPRYLETVRTSGYAFRSTDVGVVLDLMIHDLDLVLSLVRSPVRRVDALGASVLGGHEDVANARLQFANGCVATLSASRASYEAVRRMHAWSPRAFASIDFATRTTTLVRPDDSLIQGRFDVAALAPSEVDHYREHLFETLLPKSQESFAAVDALSLELADFIESISAPRQPRVGGEAGRDAVAVAEQILEQIHRPARQGDDQPLPAAPARAVPPPHFVLTPADALLPRRAAG